MTDSLPIVAELPAALRIVAILGLAVAAHFLVRLLRGLGEWMLAPARTPGAARHDLLLRRYPKVASVTSLVVSALTFLIYFAALGLVLQELRISLTAYLATASVVGLAVAFGMQGLIQDVVIGLTLIFTDAFDVGDVVEISGQIGRVEQIGLRFTTLINLHGQRVYVPNRSIAMVGRFRAGVIRAYVDVQLPESLDEGVVRETVERVARGMRAQHPAILVTDPEVTGPETAEPGGWRYLRVRFRLWPGQGALVETAFRARLLAALRALDPSYADWMITVTYRVR